VKDASSADKWLPISLAPFGADLEVCVIEDGKVYPLVIPCRRTSTGWIDAATRRRLSIEPTHWRTWTGRREE
jgi:hypothetical protein